jgi:hypothetical protein
MKLTNSKIQASNTKLKKYMSGEMEFGNDPFVSIGEKFYNKLNSNKQLFGENNFGNYEGEGESESEESEDDESEGEESESESESDSDNEMKFGIEDSEDSEDEVSED